jgi:hypothetical protein
VCALPQTYARLPSPILAILSEKIENTLSYFVNALPENEEQIYLLELTSPGGNSGCRVTRPMTILSPFIDLQLYISLGRHADLVNVESAVDRSPAQDGEFCLP